MQAIVVGGTGTVGAHVARRLAGRGHEVTVIHRGNIQAELPATVTHIRADVAALPDRDLRADVVVHTCALTQSDADSLVRLFRGRTAKLVVLSSGDVYRAYGVLRGTEPGELEPTPITEDSPLRTVLFPYPGSNYEKILVERAVTDVPDLPACILRLPAVYGPGDRAHRFGGWLRRIGDRRPVILFGERIAGWRWTHGYVENVAEAIVVAALDERAAGRVYNIGEGMVPMMRERLTAFACATAWPGQIAAGPDELLPPHLRMTLDFRQHMLVDTSHFRREFEFIEPVCADEALRRTIEWERTAAAVSASEYEAEDACISRFAGERL